MNEPKNPKTKQDHEEIFTNTLDVVKSMFNDGDNTEELGLTPMLQVLTKDNEMMLVALAMDLDVEGKDSLENMMMAFAMGGAKSITFWSEAWMAYGDPGTPVADIRPADNPNRIEVLNCTYCCELGDRVASAKIYRPPGGKSFISTWDGLPAEIGEARMADWDGWQEPRLGGRFMGPYLKAERFKEIVESRNPGYAQRFVEHFGEKFLKPQKMEGFDPFADGEMN